jgi:phosphoribosylformylglycinamidine synthase
VPATPVPIAVDPGPVDPVVVDTVDRAAATPEQPQPYRELGLADDEYLRIREILGRRPTDAELAMYSVMWSEHCSYKSSKVHLRYFGEMTTPAMRSVMLAGIGENAGVVDVGDGWAVTFKAESHNHPSYVEPYQGAATGVGGIVRDIMAMGARPIALADSLRFGPADAPDTARVLPGVVAGVGGYGNCLGLPNIGGEVVFDASYAGNPLVNALCIGVMRTEDLHLARASGAGNKILLFGARTGLDGIGGVSVLASDTFSGDTLPASRCSTRQAGLRRARSCRACRSATRSPRRCSSSAAWSYSTPAWWSASRTSAAPGCPAPPRSWRAQATGGCASISRRCRCGPLA